MYKILCRGYIRESNSVRKGAHTKGIAHIGAQLRLYISGLALVSNCYHLVLYLQCGSLNLMEAVYLLSLLASKAFIYVCIYYHLLLVINK